MVGIAAAVIEFFVWLWKLLKPKQSVQERLGVEETEAKNATTALDEVRRAAEAGDRQRAADGGRLLDGNDPAAAPYRPGPD